MSSRLRTLVAGVLVVAVILFVFRNYYGGNGLLFGDANFMWSPSLLHAELVQLLHVWRPAASGGTAGAIANESQSYVLFQALFAPFGIPLSTVLVFPFFLCIGAFSFFLFARTLGANRLGSLAGAAFFVANPWTCDQVLAGHVAILGAVCISPLIFFAFLRLRQGLTAFGFLLFALCAVEQALDPRTSIFVFTAIVIAGIAEFLRIRTADGARVRTVVGFAVIAPFYAVACNGAWTMLYAFSPYANLVPFFYPPVEDLSVFSWFSDFWHSLVLSAYFIHFSWSVADTFGAFSFVPWYTSVVLLLVIPLWAAAKRRLSYALGACAIVFGILFSMGTRAVPSWAVYALYLHVPLMSLLREPVKFSYLTVMGASVLIALAMARLRATGRAILMLALIIAIVPIVTGNLTNPDGYGFQEFTARPAYLRMLHFLEQRRAKESFRIAVFPPWLAEQSLDKGQFFTDNPFVLQSEIPVVDAKLINTANTTSEQAWQAFYGIYAGTDAHPAATLGEFGVKYVVVPAAIHLSPAAALTPFASADDALTGAILKSDRNFVPVYTDGANRIFQNLLFKRLVRTVSTPIVAGDIPAVFRQAMPPRTFGDSFGAGARSQALPPDAIAIADTPLGRCLDTHSELPSWNAYSNVTKHEDWTGYWTASDWAVSAPDTYRSRILQRFPLPFAYTESHSAIDVRVNAPRAGELYAQAATIGSAAPLAVKIDGKESILPLYSDELHWVDLGRIAAGSHVAAFTGSAAGTILRRVVADTGTCAGARLTAAPPRSRYFIPGPARIVTVNLGTKLTGVAVKPLAFGGIADNPRAWTVPTPAGAVAAAWDYLPVISGRPFASFSGYHRLTFLAPAGQPVTGTWQASDNATKNVTLMGARWPQRAEITAGDLPVNQNTIVDLSIAGTLRGAQIRIAAPGGRALVVDADSLRTPFIAIPYIGPSYTISLITPANARGTITFGADVRMAAQAGDPQLFRIPSVATATRAVHSAGTAPVIASYALTPENNLQPAQVGTLGVPVAGAQGLVLHLRKVSAENNGRAVVTAFYDAWTNPAPVKIAELAVGNRPSDYDLAVPLAPFSESVAFSLLPVDDPRLTLALGSATLTDSDPLAGGTIVSLPAMRARGSGAVAADLSQIERIPFRNAGQQYVVGSFTYDPAWSIDSRPHWQVNGYANGWRAGSSGVITYGLQGLYRALLIAGAVLWLAALAAFAFLQTRRPRTELPQDS